MPRKKTPQKPITKRITADSLEPPFVDESGEEPEFFIRYIEGGIIRDIPCSKSVFREVETKKLDMQIAKKFAMDFDRTEGVVTRIQTLAGEEDTRFEVDDENVRRPEGRFAIFRRVKVPDGTFSAVTVPRHIPEEDIDEIVGELNRDFLTEAVKPDDILAGKYIVADVRRNGTYLYVESLDT